MNHPNPTRCLDQPSLTGQGVEEPRLGKMRLLQERARVLARVPGATTAAAGPTMRVLEFEVAYERYGLDIAFIQEVAVLKDYTRLPGTPAFVMGIFNWRGRVVSVVNLKTLLGLPRKGLPYQNKVIVLRHEAMTVGLLADQVLSLRTVALEGLQAALPSMTGKRLEYLKGLTADGTAVLEAEKILTDRTILVQDEAGRVAE